MICDYNENMPVIIGRAKQCKLPKHPYNFKIMKTARYFSLLLITTIKAVAAFATISLPAIFGDQMVLQQNQSTVFWGWATPLEKVSIKVGWSTEEYTTTANSLANWALRIPTPKAGGPYEITVKGSNSIHLKDVLIGEVWLCSGQSNMEWSANSGIFNAKEEIANANHPDIRFFKVEKRTSSNPQIDLSGQWTVCTPETMSSFSAVAYFFARKIQQETGVPIGLINSSWGGTPAESWMPATAFEYDPVLAVSAATLPKAPWGPKETSVIFNCMISPLTAVKIAGVLWYQGEANTANAGTYDLTFSTLIRSWRYAWGYDFPFIYAQIAPFRYGEGNAGVRVRDQQRRAMNLPNTGMVVTSDIGDTSDIHPRNKLDVGLRMANWALYLAYGKTDIESSGPLYNSHKIGRDKIVVHFAHAEGLHSKDGDPGLFEIAGDDKVFFPATATIRKDSVHLTSDKVATPKYVRFAWSNTATPNLFNKAGLPASCFTTEF
jgi:sialate O-acetylesterase